MAIDKKTQAAEARRILALHPKELGLELAKLAAQSGLPQTKILEILRRQAAEEDKKR
ncbi:MAG TPA: hypothetical protein VD886_18835 [Herpetosiphonaceae bacterium]|nr:hypothetical protein [Herpetosiphonaceae bacterium]